MRTPRGLLAACAGLVIPVLMLPSPASAGTIAAVGGELLGAKGVVVPVGAPPLPHDLTAASWLVADLDSGTVLGARDPHGRYLPASALKTLTATTLIPKLDPARLVQPTFDDVNVEGSRVGIITSVSYPVSELFTALMVVSGNDAAHALATANGGVAQTLQEMNDEAKRLQALDTHAVTVDGLDGPGQTSSAYDLALIARAGMKLPAFRHYVATKRSSVAGPGKTRIPISSHNRLLWNYDGAIGIKNGYTVAAQATFVGAATRGGRTLVVTLMRTTPRYWPEAAALLDWGFAVAQGTSAPIGTLVEPLTDSATTSSLPRTAIVRPAAARLPEGPGGLPMLPLAIMSAGAFVLGAGVLRKRRRPRSRYRLDLPR